MKGILGAGLVALVATCGCILKGPVPERPPGQDLVEDFEQARQGLQWDFWPGKEFPGASGSFKTSAEAARGGQAGGRLTYDFSGGGAYVAAVLNLQQAPEPTAVRVWVNNPGGNGITFRYTDKAGQVLQKSLQATGPGWSEVTITMDKWDMHWGGANDGKIHGPPANIAFLVRNEGHKQGHVDLDDLQITAGQGEPTAAAGLSTYVAARWQAGHWSLQPQGAAGQSRLQGSSLVYDFTAGASALKLQGPEESLLGHPQKLHIRLRGKAPGHPLRLRLATHLMIFERRLDELNQDGEHELVVAAPPSEGWTWFGGENDGKLHGPLRLDSLLLERGQSSDRGQLELLDIRVTTSYPPQQPFVLRATYDQDERAFKAILHSLRPQETKVDLRWTIRDWDGRVILQGERAVSVPPLADPLTVPIPAPSGGQGFLEAEFSLASGQYTVSPARACWVAPVQADRTDQASPSSPFGMGVYLYRYMEKPDAAAEMDRVARLARQAGVTWIREVFPWPLVEPVKGKFDWTKQDLLVATAKRHGLRVCGTLFMWSAWTKPYSPEGIRDFSRYAAAAAKRYRDDVQYWEVWNEPNIFFWQGPRDMYAELLKQSYSAIKEANPSAKVLGCVTAGIDLSFIKRTMDLGGTFDILAAHPYRPVLDDAGFIEELRQTANIVRLPGGSSRSIWITEIGWATQVSFPWSAQHARPTDQRQQAELLARSYIGALASGVVGKTFWYDFRDDGRDPHYDEQNMGIVTYDLRPKPAYRALATLTRLLEGKRFESQLNLDQGIVAFRFADADGRQPVVAFWSTEKPQTVSLPSRKPALFIDLMGQSRRVDPVQGNLPLAARPGCPAFAVLEEPPAS